MVSTNATQQPYRDLAYRAYGGVEVVLFWNQLTDELTITVSDRWSGAFFELSADPHQALDVFNHPYAHAAFRGLPYAEASLPCWLETVANHGHGSMNHSDEPTR